MPNDEGADLGATKTNCRPATLETQTGEQTLEGCCWRDGTCGYEVSSRCVRGTALGVADSDAGSVPCVIADAGSD